VQPILPSGHPAIPNSAALYSLILYSLAPFPPTEISFNAVLLHCCFGSGASELQGNSAQSALLSSISVSVAAPTLKCVWPLRKCSFKVTSSTPAGVRQRRALHVSERIPSPVSEIIGQFCVETSGVLASQGVWVLRTTASELFCSRWLVA
jgi:hypothetical protein